MMQRIRMFLYYPLKEPFTSLLILAVFLFAVSVPFFIFVLIRFWSDIRVAAERPGGHVIFTIAAIGLGAMLAKARKDYPRASSIGEIVTGCVSCAAAFSDSSSPSMVAAVALAGGIYLIVDGFERLSEAREENELIDFRQRDARQMVDSLRVMRDWPDYDLADSLRKIGDNILLIKDLSIRMDAMDLWRKIPPNPDVALFKTRISELIEFFERAYRLNPIMPPATPPAGPAS